mmetsp:Transcript_47994/g.127157  ORF Transcript_47994/g.127157 Transcript_47994/m.127157 type:complete len:215 (+) Transcript_47994:480-1124(+)
MGGGAESCLQSPMAVAVCTISNPEVVHAGGTARAHQRKGCSSHLQSLTNWTTMFQPWIKHKATGDQRPHLVAHPTEHVPQSSYSESSLSSGTLVMFGADSCTLLRFRNVAESTDAKSSEAIAPNIPDGTQTPLEVFRCIGVSSLGDEARMGCMRRLPQGALASPSRDPDCISAGKRGAWKLSPPDWPGSNASKPRSFPVDCCRADADGVSSGLK